jgi:hypothetical protein
MVEPEEDPAEDDIYEPISDLTLEDINEPEEDPAEDDIN